jgi:hypothetical protein
VLSSPWASLYIGGGGAPYPSTKATLGRWPRGGEAAAVRVGGAQPPPKTLTLVGMGLGSRAPPFFFLP